MKMFDAFAPGLTYQNRRNRFVGREFAANYSPRGNPPLHINPDL